MAVKTVDDELQQIAKANHGILYPKDVVKFARNPKTILHGEFDWNNDSAGEKYRIWQARQLISVRVTILQKDRKEIEVPTFVSLTSDRSLNGGYRPIVNVLKDKELYAQLLKDARKDLDVFSRKYRNLSELSGVFEAIEVVFPTKAKVTA